MNGNIGFWERILIAPTPAYRRLFEAEREYLLSRIRKGASVLDVGCGDGRVLKMLSGITDDVVGIDNDQNAIAAARKALGENAKLVVGDVLSLPFADSSFDYVTLLVTLVNFDDYKADALKEMGRVLRHEGRMIVSVCADTALAERLEAYEAIGLPVERIDGGRVTFAPSAEAGVSEQFSREAFADLATRAGLAIADVSRVGTLADIYELAHLP